jgi:hypothetical protein
MPRTFGGNVERWLERKKVVPASPALRPSAERLRLRRGCYHIHSAALRTGSEALLFRFVGLLVFRSEKPHGRLRRTWGTRVVAGLVFRSWFLDIVFGLYLWTLFPVLVAGLCDAGDGDGALFEESVGAEAGPCVVFGFFDEAAAYWIAMDVAEFFDAFA